MTKIPNDITSTKATTERVPLVWSGKRSEVEHVNLPLQKVETVSKTFIDHHLTQGGDDGSIDQQRIEALARKYILLED